MKIKLLMLMTWIFYMAARRTADGVWFFCLIVCALLTACTIFYSLDTKRLSASKSKSRS
jgi:hypothetical protein